MNKCKDCKWFVTEFNNTDHKILNRKKVRGCGECRKKAPISYRADSPWPTVHEDDFCGEFETK